MIHYRSWAEFSQSYYTQGSCLFHCAVVVFDDGNCVSVEVEGGGLCVERCPAVRA